MLYFSSKRSARSFVCPLFRGPFRSVKADTPYQQTLCEFVYQPGASIVCVRLSEKAQQAYPLVLASAYGLVHRGGVIELRPPIKKILFPVQRPGVYITAEWELFFSFCPPKNLLVKISSFSYQKKKKKKKILRPPDWPQFRSPAGQETNFFLRVASHIHTYTLLTYQDNTSPVY